MTAYAALAGVLLLLRPRLLIWTETSLGYGTPTTIASLTPAIPMVLFVAVCFHRLRQSHLIRRPRRWSRRAIVVGCITALFAYWLMATGFRPTADPIYQLAARRILAIVLAAFVAERFWASYLRWRQVYTDDLRDSPEGLPFSLAAILLGVWTAFYPALDPERYYLTVAFGIVAVLSAAIGASKRSRLGWVSISVAFAATGVGVARAVVIIWVQLRYLAG